VKKLQERKTSPIFPGGNAAKTGAFDNSKCAIPDQDVTLTSSANLKSRVDRINIPAHSEKKKDSSSHGPLAATKQVC
jgi:hypothetical protein